MDTERLKALEQVVKNSEPLRLRYFEPRPAVMNAGYIREQTVEPLDCKVIGNCVYTVSIKRDWAWGTLVVSLIENAIISGIAKRVSVCFPFRRWDSALVCETAGMLAEAYTKSNYTHYDSIPEKILKQLIAGRILYYKSGGSAQNERN